MNIVTDNKVNISEKINRHELNNSRMPHHPSNLSFKNVPNSIILPKDAEIMNIFARHYGDIGENIGKKLAKLANDKSYFIRKNVRFNFEDGLSQIKSKSVFHSLAENILFPVVTLPLYAGSWVLKKAQKIPFLAEGAKKLYRKPLFRTPRKINELCDKTDIIDGMYNKTKQVVSDFAASKNLNPSQVVKLLNKNKRNLTPESKKLASKANLYIKENLYKVSNKFFDKHTGNFNTAYERPLNRIVSGLIPVLFLANDAYNLSVMCGDTKEMSKKEAKERKTQEISRVLITAYLQLLTFGAFTKQVNTSPFFATCTAAATVLISEIFSRKRLGKPIAFLSKEKAKEYNKIHNKSVQEEEHQPIQTSTKNYTANNKCPDIFKSFMKYNTNPVIKDNQDKPKKEEQKKALINMKTFKIAVAALFGAGLVISVLKNSSMTKDSKFITELQEIGKKIKSKCYDKFAFKDFEMKNKDFEEIIKTLKNAGCNEIAEGHELIKNKYAKQTANGMIKMYKSKLEPEAVTNILKNITTDIKQGNRLNKEQISIIEESVKTAISKNSVAIAEKNYSQTVDKAIEIIKNKKADITDDMLNRLSSKLLREIKNNVTEAPIQVDTKIKPFIDIFIEPFRFMFSALKLPFKVFSLLVRIIASPIEKKAGQAQLGKAELTKFEKTVHDAVTNVLGTVKEKDDKINQTIFVNAIEKLKRKTSSFRTALAQNNWVYNKSMEAKKDKLNRYITNAVEKSFNGVTQSSNKNTDLAIMSKMASSAVTSAFLVADNYNMVMIKSNGENKEGAKEKANERIIQRLSALFYQSMLINWFNATFRNIYNSSLKGMAAVVIPNTITTEILTRKSIGMPIGRKTYEELQAIDKKNENRKGFLGQYFKFMRLLTGKKPLKDRMPKDKVNTAVNTDLQIQKTDNLKNTTTNLVKMYSK